MQSIRLSDTQLLCSRMGYGCWRIAGWEGAECTPERELHGRQAVIASFEAGFTLFDHAYIYSDGMGEVIFGKVLKEIPEFRGRAIIASKCGIRRAGKADRSEEHTSELQSPMYLVCRLLLEKKKKN